MINKIKNIKDEFVTVAIVGKYVQLEDSYLSVIESLKHGGFANDIKVKIDLIDSESITNKNVNKILSKYDGIIVPGGFGTRGTEGKLETIKYARENDVPFLGICLGMQMAVIEFARNVANLEDANSEELDKNCKNPVIHIMEDQKDIHKKGGTMRLGAYPCVLKEGSLAEKIYGKKEISERHRHRYEFNNYYKKTLENKGLICSGISPDGSLVEIVENPSCKFFIAGQFHPELKSRPDRPAPLFVKFVEAMKK